MYDDCIGFICFLHIKNDNLIQAKKSSVIFMDFIPFIRVEFVD